MAVFRVGREEWWMRRHGGNKDIFGGCRGREVGMRGVLWMTNLGALVAAAELQIIDLAFRIWVSLGFIVGLTPFIWAFLVFRLRPIWSLMSYMGFVAFYGFGLGLFFLVGYLSIKGLGL